MHCSTHSSVKGIIRRPHAQISLHFKLALSAIDFKIHTFTSSCIGNCWKSFRYFNSFKFHECYYHYWKRFCTTYNTKAYKCIQECSVVTANKLDSLILHWKGKTLNWKCYECSPSSFLFSNTGPGKNRVCMNMYRFWVQNILDCIHSCMFVLCILSVNLVPKCLLCNKNDFRNVATSTLWKRIYWPNLCMSFIGCKNVWIGKSAESVFLNYV